MKPKAIHYRPIGIIHSPFPEIRWEIYQEKALKWMVFPL